MRDRAGIWSLTLAIIMVFGWAGMAVAGNQWVEVIPGKAVPAGAGVVVDVEFWFHSVDDNGVPLEVTIKGLGFNVGFDDLEYNDHGEVVKGGETWQSLWTWGDIAPMTPNFMGTPEYRQGIATKHDGSIYWNVNVVGFPAGNYLVASDFLIGTAHVITTPEAADLIVSGEDVWLEYQAGWGFSIDGLCGDCKLVPTSGPDYAAQETGFYLDLDKFPWRPADDPLSKYSGPAVAEMWLSYLWWNNIDDPAGPPDLGQYASPLDDYTDQDWLYTYGHGENQTVNASLELLDARGLRHTVQYLDPPWSPYHYNFSYYIKDNVDDALNDICHWIAYPAGGGVANPNGHGTDGHPVNVPAAVPTGGNYENWMAVRGIHTSTNPWSTSGYDIYGFWINDPNPVPSAYPGDSLGANSFKSVDQFKNEYFVQLTGLLEGDQCKDKWVSILEPPEYEAEIRIVRPRARFERQISPMQMEKVMLVKGIERLAVVKEVEDEDALDVVKAAVDGVNEHLVPYDSRFAEVFAETVPGMPLLVNDEKGDYYLVPFNLPVKPEYIKKKYEIQKVDRLAQKVDKVKIVANNIVIQPIIIDDPAIVLNKKNTLVVVIVDAEDGSFRETTWENDPMDYLPVSLNDALELVSDETGNVDGADAELIYSEFSPYYPDWKITVGEVVYTVSQDGTVTL